VRWQDFYGRTAEKFFYHPTDRNSTYHTETVLTQRPQKDASGEGGVPAAQGVPAHQRPPQFDYIYRANTDAQKQAEAEVATMAGAESSAERDTAGAFDSLDRSVAAAWREADERIMGQQALLLDSDDINTALGRFVAAAKRLPNVTKNVPDANRLAVEGDRAGD